MEVAERDGVPVQAQLPVLVEAIGPDKFIPLERFNDEQRRRIAQVDASVSMDDTNSMEAFAAAPQRKFSGFLDGLMQEMKAGEQGEAGALVADLADAVGQIDLPAMRKNAEKGDSFLARVPLIGGAFSRVKRFYAMQKKLKTHLDNIESRGLEYMNTVKSGVSSMDRMLDATEHNLRDLEIWLAGGQQALIRLRREFQQERSSAGLENDPIRLARLRDRAEQISMFETRLVRIHMGFSRGILSVPQIRTAQSAGRIEFANTMDTVLTDIPDIKSALIQIANIRQISKATDASEKRRELRRRLGTLAADTLDEAYTKAKQSQGDMAEDIQSLAILTGKTLETIRRGAEIDARNSVARKEAMAQIGEVRRQLVDGLKAHAAQSAIEG